MDFSLKVTPEVLEKWADDCWQTIARIERHFNAIEEIAARTRGYWIGEAGDRDRACYDSFKDDIACLLDRLDEHPGDLLKMAGIYKMSNRKALETANQLKTDLIV